jgi:hypothetical protein
MKRFFKEGLMILTAGIFCLNVSAQEESPIHWSGNLQTEGNVNFNNGEANGNALFFLDADAKVWKGGKVVGGFMSMYNIRLDQDKSWSVVSDQKDRTWFTNISLYKQLPFTLAVLGFSQQITDNFDIFFGVRKTDYDYFTTPYSSLFFNTGVICNSTMNSDRWNIANFNTAALCFHFDWEFLPGFTFKNSIYNGNGTDQVSKMFNFRPNRDGIMDIAELGYKGWSDDNYFGEYHLGVVYGNTYLNEYEGIDHKKRSEAVVYASINQPVLKGKYPVGIFGQGSLGKKNIRSAYDYFSLGALMDNLLISGSRAGVNINRAIFANGEHESDLEVTYNFPVFKGLNLQPGVHFIRTTGQSSTAGLVRAFFTF